MPRIRRFHISPSPSPSSAPHSRSICSHIAVSTAPGQMQFDVIRCAASDWAAERVRLTTPALDAEYGVIR